MNYLKSKFSISSNSNATPHPAPQKSPSPLRKPHSIGAGTPPVEKKPLYSSQTALQGSEAVSQQQPTAAEPPTKPLTVSTKPPPPVQAVKPQIPPKPVAQESQAAPAPLSPLRAKSEERDDTVTEDPSFTKSNPARLSIGIRPARRSIDRNRPLLSKSSSIAENCEQKVQEIRKRYSYLYEKAQPTITEDEQENNIITAPTMVNDKKSSAKVTNGVSSDATNGHASNGNATNGHATNGHANGDADEGNVRMRVSNGGKLPAKPSPLTQTAAPAENGARPDNTMTALTAVSRGMAALQESGQDEGMEEIRKLDSQLDHLNSYVEKVEMRVSENHERLQQELERQRNDRLKRRESFHQRQQSQKDEDDQFQAQLAAMLAKVRQGNE